MKSALLDLNAGIREIDPSDKASVSFRVMDADPVFFQVGDTFGPKWRLCNCVLMCMADWLGSALRIHKSNHNAVSSTS